jgi:two-component system sensor histidine kinase KdpD
MTALSTSRRVQGLVLALALPPLVTVVLLPARGNLNLVSDALLLLLTVVSVALVGGLIPALIAALSATALLNYFFTPPLHTWRVTDANNVVALAVFGAVAALVSWAVDEAARRRREAVRVASLEAATNVRTALLAAVGHDLRTPLAAAKASITGLLSEDVELSADDRTELLRGADESLDKLAGLVANILDVSRLQLGAIPVVRRATALDDVVSRALDDLGSPDVDVDVPDDLPEALADGGLLERVVANLVQNALRYSTSVSVRGCVADGRLELHVVDQGPGIPADRREAVFAPFQRLGDTNNTEGLGLGLAVARGLVEAMGGTLVLADPAARGVTMVVSLETSP